jgi:CheY-like chemotaxis protein
VLIAPDRPKALALLATAHPDLILVDVNGQTLALIDAIRSGEGLAGCVDPDTPLIALSRDADRLQRIRVLERGGDDVVRKPFAYPELRARIGAVLRRSETRRGARILRAGPIVIDVRSREVRVFDRLVELSAKEYDLLVTLARQPVHLPDGRGRTLSADVDSDAPPPILDHVRIAMTADLGSDLEKVDIVGVSNEVGRGHAASTGADDRHTVSMRSRPRGSYMAGR